MQNNNGFNYNVFVSKQIFENQSRHKYHNYELNHSLYMVLVICSCFSRNIGQTIAVKLQSSDVHV